MSRKAFFRRLAALEGRSIPGEYDPDSPPDYFDLARRIAYIFDLSKRIMSVTASPPPDFTAEEFVAVAERIFEHLYPTEPTTKEA